MEAGDGVEQGGLSLPAEGISESFSGLQRAGSGNGTPGSETA